MHRSPVCSCYILLKRLGNAIRQFLANLGGLLFHKSSKTPRTNNLLGAWTSIKVQYSAIKDGKISSSADDVAGDCTYIFTSETRCYLISGFTTIQHPHSYKIIGDKIYITIDPDYLKKIGAEEEEIYGIDLTPSEWIFSMDKNKKCLYFTEVTETSYMTYKAMLTFKKIE